MIEVHCVGKITTHKYSMNLLREFIAVGTVAIRTLNVYTVLSLMKAATLAAETSGLILYNKCFWCRNPGIHSVYVFYE